MPQEKITIQFQPKGDKDLLLAIQKLAAAQARLEKTTKKAKQQLKEMGMDSVLATNHLRNFERTSNKAASAFSVLRSKLLLGSFAFSLVAGSVGALAKKYATQEAAERKLAIQLGKTSKELVDYAAAKQQITRFGDEETIAAMATAAAYMKNEDAIKRITDAAMDYSVLTGQDLNQAVKDVSKSIFTSTNVIGKQVGAIDGIVGSSTRFESAMQKIASVAGGLAEGEATTLEVQLKQMSDAAGDLAEAFGSFLAPAVRLFASTMKQAAEFFDVDKIKSYATVIGGAALAYGFLSGAIIRATKAVLTFTKAQAKNLLLLAGVIIVSEIVDAMGVYDTKTKELEKDLASLNKELDRNTTATALNAKQKMEWNQRYVEADALAVQHEKELAYLRGETWEGEKLGFTNQIEQKIIAKRNEMGFIREAEESNHISRTESLARRREVNAEIKKLEIDLFHFKRRQQQKRIELAASGLNALGDVLALNEKNAKHVARVQAIAAGVSAFSAAQGSYDQTAQILPPPAPAIAYGITLAAGLAQAASVWQEANKMEFGGYIGGKRHSEGGTMIEAERGEFVMRRSAVEAIGLENLNKMNRTGQPSGAVNITFSGNVISDDFIEDVAIPKIKDAIRRGADIGIG
jgi:hypothetical protein